MARRGTRRTREVANFMMDDVNGFLFFSGVRRGCGEVDIDTSE
jgi:hypothetical protein